MSWTAKKKQLESSSFTPRKYQKRSIKDGIVNEVRGYFLAPGLGKTIIVEEVYRKLKEANHVNYMLVVAPLLPARKVWMTEHKKWGLDFDVTLLHGGKRAKKCYEEHDIYVINFEGLRWLVPLMLKDTTLNWDMLIIDESSFTKHHNTKRFQKLKLVLHRFHRRYILTGSPAPNSYMDLWSQIYLLDRGKALGRYITHYRNKYFEKKTVTIKKMIGGKLKEISFPQYSLKDDAEEEINDAIKPLITRFGKEMLDLPPLHINPIYIDLPQEARQLYEEMKEELYIMMGEGSIITAANAAVKSQKLRQIANGGAYVTAKKDKTGKIELMANIKNSKRAVEIHFQKAEAVVNLVEELQGEPLLVIYEFGHDLRRLLKVLPKRGVDYIGQDHPAAKADDIIDRWNAGKLTVLLGQPRSVAWGLNLQYSGRHICMHSLIWSLEKYEQSYQRLWRQGQKNPVFLHQLIAENTVDEIVIEALNHKDNRQKRLLKGLTTHLEE